MKMNEEETAKRLVGVEKRRAKEKQQEVRAL